MISCPKCHSPNLPEARRCVHCGEPLPGVSVAAPPTLPAIPLDASTRQANSASRDEQSHLSDGGTGTLNVARVFLPRPVGAIFDNRFEALSVIYSDERLCQYLVAEFDLPEGQRLRQCPAVGCGAIHSPWVTGVAEQYCTVCGTPLQLAAVELLLTESDRPIFDNARQLVDLGLVHSHVRAPLAYFTEMVGAVLRYCLVTPKVEPLPAHIEPSQALSWGVGLAQALDYLAANGLTFGGAIDESCFALAGKQAVWANLACSLLHPDRFDEARRADVRSLAALLFKWLTGHSQFVFHPSLSAPLNACFEQALVKQGFASGQELAEALEEAIQHKVPSAGVDYRLGRYTHVGMVRSLNEDSLLTLEIVRILQSQPRSLGVYVVADGMGGHSAGEVASATVVNAIAQRALALFNTPSVQAGVGTDWHIWLKSVVETANNTVFEMRKSTGTDMGTTMVMAVLDGWRVHVAHVGDSRAYCINAQAIRRLTTDHSLVQRLIETRQITPQEARRHPQRNVIYRTMGDKPKVEADIQSYDLQPGDCILLCSDGLSGMLDDADIHRLVLASPNPQVACEKLIAAANAAGGDDNITAVLVQLVQLS